MTVNSNAGEIVKGFYMAEQEGQIQDCFDMKITVRVNASSASMFNAIAGRFNTSRFNLLQTVLDSAAKDMFSALSPEDRAVVAEIADKETTDVLFKQGITSISSAGWAGSFDGEDATWRNFLTPEQLEVLTSQNKASK